MVPWIIKTHVEVSLTDCVTECLCELQPSYTHLTLDICSFAHSIHAVPLRYDDLHSLQILINLKHQCYELIIDKKRKIIPIGVD